MRVITGSARGRKLKSPAGLETRPTSEICKEAVFSMLQPETEGAKVLDLFAGSGQMGVEALSRGASACVFVDNAKACRTVIEENLKHTGLSEHGRVVSMDAASYLRNASDIFDIAFLDPPYGKFDIEKILTPLSEIMRENGIIVCESEKQDMLPDSAGRYGKYREYRYGRAKITVYRGGVEG